MAKVAPIQTNFSGGEMGPLTRGRVDIDRYKTGLETCLNYIPSLQGGLYRRPGSKFVSEIKASANTARLIEFEFSVTQAYVLEFGDEYIRFYKDQGQIESSPGTPYEIVTTYQETDLFDLKFVQSADVLYIVHEDYAPRKLSRTSDTAWTLTTIDFQDGPYLPLNATATTLTPSAATGTAVTLTASSTTGINTNTGFQSSDIGRSIRLREGGTWGWCEITGVTSATVATVSVASTLTNTSAKSFWRLGVWSGTTGYPSCLTFHEDRLFFAGVSDYPQRVDASVVGEYENFAPSDTAGTIIDSNALSFTLNATDVNAVRWLVSDEKGLLAGSVGGEWIIRPSSQSEALTPSNITAKRSTVYGSADIQAVQVGKSAIFLQRSGRKLREITYYFDVDGFRALDLNILAEHITESSIKQMTYQREPQPILWCVRNDGVLVGLTYERDIDSFKAGWHKHVMGGVSDAGTTDAQVESVACIPSSDGSTEELWMIVKRYINGGVKRYIEFLTPVFEDSTEQKNAFFVDCGLTYDSPLTITGVSIGTACTITASNTLSNGDKILITGVKGTTELNTNSYLVQSVGTASFQITSLTGTVVNSSAFTTYVSGGQARKYVSTISGLTHLNGQSVAILGDGAVQPNQTVSGGSISLAVAATTVHIGLGYTSDGKLLRLDSGSSDGTSIGKTRRMHRVGIMLHRSLGLKIGTNFDNLTELTFRTFGDSLSRAPELFTGILSELLDANYDFENQFCFRQDQPLPSTLLAIMPQMATQDR